MGLPLLREHKGKALDGTFLCFSLIKQVTFRQFDCWISFSGTGMVMPRKALNGFGNHWGPVCLWVFLTGCDCKCLGSWSDEASPALCCVNVRVGFGTFFLCDSLHRVELSQGTCKPLLFNFNAAHGTIRGYKSEQVQPCSGQPVVEAVFAVGKAVWCSVVVLLKFPGPLFLKTATGEQSKVALVTISSELCHLNFEKVLSLSVSLKYVIFFSFFSSYCFDPNGLCGCLQAGTKCRRLKSQLWSNCG